MESYNMPQVSQQEEKDSSVYELIVTQMNQENINSRVYQNFSGICDLKAMLGAEKYFYNQSQDEKEHQKKLYDYICTKGWVPTLKTVPEEEFNVEWSLLEMFAQAVQLEKENLTTISAIQKKALETSDFETFNFIGWFVQNQTSEIDEMTKWVQKFQLASESPAAILFLDEQLGEG